MKREIFLCKESVPYLSLTVILNILLYIIAPWLLIPGLILLAFLLWFFRNPTRPVDETENILISPADGKVMSITEVDDDFVGAKAQKITIFLSVFNVHVNRTPGSGTVEYYNYRPGKFLPAYKPHASDENERATIGVKMSDGFRYKVRQITGILARRIVCDVKVGDEIKKGQRFGMIKFGSCTELLLPAGTEITVRPGDKVRGNKTSIAKKG